MKPKTKIQKEVARLSATLRPITATQKQWAYSQCFEHIAYRGKNGSMVCSECTHEWTAEGKQGNKCRCPKCGVKLTVSHSLKRRSTQLAHFAVVTTRENFQVIRVVHVKYRSRKGEKAEYIVNEALQRWFDAEGNEVNIARKNTLCPDTAMRGISTATWRLGAAPPITTISPYTPHIQNVVSCRLSDATASMASTTQTPMTC